MLVVVKLMDFYVWFFFTLTLTCALPKKTHPTISHPHSPHSSGPDPLRRDTSISLACLHFLHFAEADRNTPSLDAQNLPVTTAGRVPRIITGLHVGAKLIDSYECIQ
ncbi:hypothetical protein DFH29DRAFT_894897 [Suillus ampliporus]|nr:hypothetical protein DFH29DRAFT_894897 [Suillus ampliporus]